MLNNLMGPEIKELIEKKDWETIKEVLTDWPAPDIADFLSNLDQESEMPIVFRLLPKELAAEVFSELDADIQETLLTQMNNTQISQILLELPADDRTSLFEELPGKVTQKLLNLLPPEDRKESLKLLGYPEHSVGRLMNPDYVAVKPHWTIEQALEHIRKKGIKKETLNIIYVVDEKWKLIGSIELQQFILGQSHQKVEEIIDSSFTFAKLYATDDRKKAVEIMEHYNLSALPVVDSEETLLGIVTFDDVMDVAQEVVTKDFHKKGGMRPLEENYLKASIFTLFRKRISWLVILIFVNIFSGAAISNFEDLISQVVALVFFLPLLIDSGGNAGSQASTLVVRAMATGEIEMRDWFKLFFKDIFVSFLMGIVMALTVSFLGFYRGGSLEIALTVSLAMLSNVVIGSCIGTLLPFFLKLLRFDPAAASGPLITSLADISGVLIYFTIATYILKLPN